MLSHVVIYNFKQANKKVFLQFSLSKAFLIVRAPVFLSNTRLTSHLLRYHDASSQQSEESEFPRLRFQCMNFIARQLWGDLKKP